MRMMFAVAMAALMTCAASGASGQTPPQVVGAWCTVAIPISVPDAAVSRPGDVALTVWFFGEQPSVSVEAGTIKGVMPEEPGRMCVSASVVGFPSQPSVSFAGETWVHAVQASYWWLGPPDVDDDGDVDIGDIETVRGCIGSTAVGNCERADVNGDGVINVLNLLLVRNAR